MYNKCFEYLLDNRPDRVLSKFGVKFRKRVNWIFRRIMAPMSSKNKLCVERRSYISKDENVIYAATHGFKDDIAYSIAATNRHCYLLLGALNILFESIYGVALWFNGLILVNREDKESRTSSLAKMEKLLYMGANLIMFPEATWNKSENLLVLDLFPGIYNVAMATGTRVVPIASIEENGCVYVIVDEPFDITQFDREEGLIVLRDKMASAKYELMEKYSQAKRNTLVSSSDYWGNYIDKIIEDADGLYNRIAESKAAFIDKRKASYEEVFSCIHRIIPSIKNAFLFRR